MTDDTATKSPERLGRRDQSRLVLAMCYTLVVVIGGFGWTWHIGQEANGAYHELFHAREALKSMRGAATSAGATHNREVRR